MTVSEALAWAVRKLQEAKVPEPRTDAEWLLTCVLKASRTSLKLNPESPLIDEQWSAYEKAVLKRAERIPLPYLIGDQPFCGLVLKVDKRVMIPRAETEQLVEIAVKRLKGLGGGNLMLADIGTGSGAIALALTSRFPQATVIGVDISTDALEVAERNAQLLGLTKQCVFLHGDLTEPLEAIYPPETFDAIVANLPYVADSEWEELEPEIKYHEPEIALRGGRTGFPSSPVSFKDHFKSCWHRTASSLWKSKQGREERCKIYLWGKAGVMCPLKRIFFAWSASSSLRGEMIWIGNDKFSAAISSHT